MQKKPNILFIIADQLRYDALGCYGNTQIHTPNIDKLSMNGSTFDNHFIQNPVCGPSRCSILTGRYPKNHGTRDNGIPLQDSEITIPEVLRDNGYETAAIGKMHLTTQFKPKEREEEDWPDDNYGFNVIHTSCDTKTGEYLDYLKEHSMKNYKAVLEQGKQKMKEDTASASEKNLDGPPQLFKSDVDAEFHQTTWIADRTIDFINSCDDDKPFFAYCSFVDPHNPFDPPKPYDSMYDIGKLELPIRKEGELEDKPPHFMKHRVGKGFSNEKYDYRKLSDEDWLSIKSAYYGMITLIDHNIGRMIEALKQKNILDNTLVIFTADHGELLGDHGLLFKGPFHYDSIIKAPMILSLTDVVPKGSRYRQITEHVDLMSTILDYAGIRAPNGVQGISMSNILRGDKGAGRKYSLTEFNCYDWGLSIKTIVSKDYKLTYYAGEQYGELYDRNEDPNEFVNLWDDYNYCDVKTKLINELLTRVIETEDTIPLRIGKF